MKKIIFLSITCLACIICFVKPLEITCRKYNAFLVTRTGNIKIPTVSAELIIENLRFILRKREEKEFFDIAPQPPAHEIPNDIETIKEIMRDALTQFKTTPSNVREVVFDCKLFFTSNTTTDWTFSVIKMRY